MEARVDIKKLQLLNDRIVQTIEALNQVRLSVHGLQQTGAPLGALNFGQPFVGSTSGFGLPIAPVGYNVPYAGVSGFPGGLPSTNVGALTQPFFGAPISGYTPSFSAATSNLGPSVANWPIMGTTGLSHSAIEEQWLAEMRAQDPRRLSQTFPYCYNP